MLLPRRQLLLRAGLRQHRPVPRRELLPLLPLPLLLLRRGKDSGGEVERRGHRGVIALVAEIELEAAAQRERTGSKVLGVAAIRRQQPHGRPKGSKKSPAPLFHTFSQTVRKELYE